MSKDNINVYTDGSCVTKNNVSISGYGIFFPEQEFKNISKKIKKGKQTNQRAELHAIFVAIRICRKYNVKKITIYSDSISTDSSFKN